MLSEPGAKRRKPNEPGHSVRRRTPLYTVRNAKPETQNQMDVETDPIEINPTDSRMDPAFDVALSFYNTPPVVGEITIEEFEIFAISRLKGIRVSWFVSQLRAH